MNDKFAAIQSAANAGAFGRNGYALPSIAQLNAGNYLKGRFELYGLSIAIETPQGTARMGKSDGKPWSVICQAHYGDIAGTLGADGDPVDCYVGPVPESDRVFVVNQNGKSGAFDEHKVMLAFADEDSARTAYLNSYERGWNGLGSMVSASVSQFTWWLKYGNTRVPFDKSALPYHGDDDMTDITWDSAAQPVQTDLASLIYGLRQGDGGGLLLDALSMSEILDAEGEQQVLDALVVVNSKLDMKMEQLMRIMAAASETVQPVAKQISAPFKQKGTTNIVALFELSDGQTVAIYLHNPDSTPNKILPDDELVSWKWLLNKKDVTILVAPEKGRDLNPREVARRVMRLAEKNSAKFTKANGDRAARMAAIEAAKVQVTSKEATLAAIEAEISELTVQVEAKRAIAPPMPGGEQGGAQSFEALAKLHTPAQYVSSGDPDGFTAVDPQGWGLRLRLSPNGRGVSSYMIQPGNIGFDSLGMSSLAEGLEPAVIKAIGVALDRIRELRVRTNAAGRPAEPEYVTRSKAVKAALGALGWDTTAGSTQLMVAIDGSTYSVRSAVQQAGKGAMTLVWKDDGSTLQWPDEPELSADAMAAKIDGAFRAAIAEARAAVAGTDGGAVSQAGTDAGAGATMTNPTGKKLVITLANGDKAVRSTYNLYTAAVVGYDKDGKLQVLSAHWSKRDALGAISNFKAGKHVNFNYRDKLVGEPFLVTAPEEGVSPAPTPDPAPAPTPGPAPAPEPDPAQVEALALLQSVIDGTASMDAALADRLLAAHEKFAGGAEFDPLFEQASQAYADAMVAKARTALAA